MKYREAQTIYDCPEDQLRHTEPLPGLSPNINSLPPEYFGRLQVTCEEIAERSDGYGLPYGAVSSKGQNWYIPRETYRPVTPLVDLLGPDYVDDSMWVPQLDFEGHALSEPAIIADLPLDKVEKVRQLMGYKRDADAMAARYDLEYRKLAEDPRATFDPNAYERYSDRFLAEREHREWEQERRRLMNRYEVCENLGKLAARNCILASNPNHPLGNRYTNPWPAAPLPSQMAS